MNVIIYPNPSMPAPAPVVIVSPGNDTLEEYAFKYLDPFGIGYLIVPKASLPNASYIYPSLLLEISGGAPVWSYDLAQAKDIATDTNSNYWQNQYNTGLLGLSITNDYQLQLAIATPEDERTAEQLAAVEFLSGISTLQTQVQTNIDAATTGEEIIQILGQLG
jgi:hypothetical protein